MGCPTSLVWLGLAPGRVGAVCVRLHTAAARVVPIDVNNYQIVSMLLRMMIMRMLMIMVMIMTMMMIRMIMIMVMIW